MTRPRLALMTLLVALVAGSACSTAGTGSSSRNSSVVSAEELQTVATFSVMDALRRIRPAWLRARSNASPPVVVVDGVRMGSVEVLHTLRADQFVEIRHRTGSDATTLYGTGVAGGVIELTTH
ncbi:hypothetical protein [Gaopeijia maritima]|uniref:TonB-dependent receptor plug domain-containing protein n=1 Tax=Gaopeijia maritima TaxID=3119007 RepID=A0ABU9E4R5_9BACT